MIGLSVSLCIRDIAGDKVDIKDVEKIIAGTAVDLNTPACVDALIRRYAPVYWREFPETAERIFRKLLAERKIEQPRLKDNRHRPHISDGHWVDQESEIVWHDRMRATG